MTNKVAIITGSGSGIGAASAVRLAKNGWNIVINYASRIDSAREVAKACEMHGAETLLCKANVAEDAELPPDLKALANIVIEAQPKQ